MPESLIIEEDQYSPGVIFNPTTNEYKIWGKSLPENPEKMYRPVLEWAEAFAKDPSSDMTLQLDLVYLNTASTKWLKQVLAALGEMNRKGKKLSIEWVYEEFDEDMQDLGEDLKNLTGLEFTFTEKPEE